MIAVEENAVYPVLFTVAGWEIRSYTVFLCLGILAGLLAGWGEARRIGYGWRRIAAFMLFVLPLALGLGLVNGWLFNPDFYTALAHSRVALRGGLISFGALVGAFLAGGLFARVVHEPLGRGTDPIALVLPLVLGITRIGCLLNGCCFGREAEGFGTLYLPGRFGVWADRYPTQLILMVFDFLLFAWLWKRRTVKPYEGDLTVSFLLWFSLIRLVVDGLRDLPVLFLGLSLHQVFAAVTLLCMAALALIIRALAAGPRASRRRTRPD